MEVLTHPHRGRVEHSERGNLMLKASFCLHQIEAAYKTGLVATQSLQTLTH